MKLRPEGLTEVYMTDKELKKLGRAELLEMLLQVTKENEGLKEDLNTANAGCLQQKAELEETSNELMAAVEKIEALKSELKEAYIRMEGGQAELEELRGKLQDRSIAVEEAGTLAEASMKLNGVFDAAQAAAAQYLDNIKNLSARQEEICARREQESAERCDSMLKDTEQRCMSMMNKVKDKCKSLEEHTLTRCMEQEKTTRDTCRELKEGTKQEVEAYWNDLTQRMESFYDSHKGMRELLTFYDMKLPSFKNLKGEE